MLIEKLARERARRGLTLPRARIVNAFAQVLGKQKPTKLARGAPVITFVGGPQIPGAIPAVGVWPHGAERSNVLTVADATEAEQVARGNQQHTAIWFQPGPGEDALHILPASADPRAQLSAHGVSYATVTKDRVYVVDQGGQFVGVLGGRTLRGRATFKELDGAPTKLARDDYLKSYRGKGDITALGVMADEMEEEGRPGAGLARAAWQAKMAGEPAPMWSGARTAGPMRALGWSTSTVPPESRAIHSPGSIFVNVARLHNGPFPIALEVMFNHDTQEGAGLPDTRVSFHVKSRAHLEGMLKDLPEHMRKDIRKDAWPHLPKYHTEEPTQKS